MAGGCIVRSYRTGKIFWNTIRRHWGLILIAGLWSLAGGCSDGTSWQDASRTVPAAADGARRYPVEDLLTAALKRAEDMDPQARLVRLALNAGNRELAFESAGFVFNSPRLTKVENKPAAFSITLDEGMVVHQKTAVEAWSDSPQKDVSPREVMAAALNTNLAPFLDRYPTSVLYMELRPSVAGDKYTPTAGRWIWQVMGIGPGMTEVYLVYLDAATHAVLGTRRKNILSAN